MQGVYLVSLGTTIGFISMARTNRYLQNTDFILLASDDVGNITLNVPSGSTIPAGANKVFESFQDIGASAAAPLRCIFNFNNSSEYVITNRVLYSVSVNVGSFPTTGSIEISVERYSGNIIRLYALYQNSASSTVTITSNIDIQVKVRTFKTPFSS